MDYKIWDIHVHNWSVFADPDIFERHLKETGVDHLTLLGPLTGGLDPSPLDVERSNTSTVDYITRFGPRVSGLCYVNPSHPEHALNEWLRCETRGMIGLKIWVGTLCDDHRVDPVLRDVFSKGRPVIIHAWRKTDGNLPGESNADHVVRLAKRHPTGKIVMAHMAGDWEYGLKAVRDFPNIWVDFAGTINEAGAYEMAIREVGEDRILFGTDGPADYYHCLARVLKASITGRAKRKILFENAQRLFS